MIKNRTLLPLLLVLSLGCQSEPPPEDNAPLTFPGTGVGKADIFGRALAGLAALAWPPRCMPAKFCMQLEPRLPVTAGGEKN